MKRNTRTYREPHSLYSLFLHSLQNPPQYLPCHPSFLPSPFLPAFLYASHTRYCHAYTSVRLACVHEYSNTTRPSIMILPHDCCSSLSHLIHLFPYVLVSHLCFSLPHMCYLFVLSFIMKRVATSCNCVYMSCQRFVRYKHSADERCTCCQARQCFCCCIPPVRPPFLPPSTVC